MSFKSAITTLNNAVQKTFGDPAIFTPKGGVEQTAPVYVILDQRDGDHNLGAAFNGAAPSSGSVRTLEIQVSEIEGGVLAKDDKFEIAGTGIFFVNSIPQKDAHGLVWTCDLRGGA